VVYKNVKNEITGKLTMEELSLFSYQLSVIMKSGVPYLEGLELMKNELEGGTLKQLAERLYEDVKDGKKLHESMAGTEIFPQYFVQMTEIAEKAGMLDVEMERLSRFYEKQEALRYKVRSALVYPIILFVLMAAVLALLVLKVFPVFQNVLASLGGNLPASSSALFGVIKTMQQAALWIMAAVAAILAGLLFYTRSDKGGTWFDSYKLESKTLGNFYKKLVALRFSQGMSMMVRAGIPFEDAIAMSAPLTGNRFAEQKLQEAQNKLHHGDPIPDSIESAGVFPSLFNQMLRIGVKSGQVDSTLEKLSEIYETELDRAAAKLTSSIEPALVIVLSVVIGIILLTVMLPMIQIMSSIG
jgi:type IV pilus assembly protein PilC